MTDAFLAPLGVGAEAESLYRTLLGLPGQSHATLDDAQRGWVEELRAAGLVDVLGDRLLVLPARLAVERWAAVQEERIAHARAGVARLVAGRSAPDSFLEVVRGREAARALCHHLETNAQHQIRAFDRDPYLSESLGEISPAQEAVSAQGVAYRVLYQSTVLEDSAVMGAVRAALELGEEARAYPRVPVRMILCDDALALVVLPFGSDAEGGALDVDAVLVHPSTLFDALAQLFEALWALGVPIRPDDTADDRSRHILSLLATGMTDASIARELGMSQRTLLRRINHLHEQLGTTSRFQLGAQAAIQGWI